MRDPTPQVEPENQHNQILTTESQVFYNPSSQAPFPSFNQALLIISYN
jgi:hypothetical protein